MAQSVDGEPLFDQLLLLSERQLCGDVEFAEILNRARPLLLAVVLAWKIVLLEGDSARPRAAAGLAGLPSKLTRVLILLAGRIILAVHRRRRGQRDVDGKLDLVYVVLIIRLLRLLLLLLRLQFHRCRCARGGDRWRARRRRATYRLQLAVQVVQQILANVAAHVAVEGTVELGTGWIVNGISCRDEFRPAAVRLSTATLSLYFLLFRSSD